MNDFSTFKTDSDSENLCGQTTMRRIFESNNPIKHVDVCQTRGRKNGDIVSRNNIKKIDKREHFQYIHLGIILISLNYVLHLLDGRLNTKAERNKPNNAVDRSLNRI